MVFCPNCGKEVPADTRFCPNCDYDMQSQAVPATAPVVTVPLPPKRGFTSPKNLAYYSIICGVAAFLIFPIPLLVVGLVLGAWAVSKGEKRLGGIGIILSIIGGLAGAILGIILFSA